MDRSASGTSPGAASGPRTATVTVPGRVTVLRFDGRGRLLDRGTATGLTAREAACGFTVVA